MSVTSMFAVMYHFFGKRTNKTTIKLYSCGTVIRSTLRNCVAMSIFLVAGLISSSFSWDAIFDRFHLMNFSSFIGI